MVNVVDEADSYTSAVRGVTVETARVGRGIGPNHVVGVPGEHLTVTSARFGFPMTAGAYVPDDRMLAAYVHENPAESRWCGVPLREGSVVVYPPGAEHVAVNQPGLHFTFAITEPESLMAHADRLGVPAELPAGNRLWEIPASRASELLGKKLNRLTRAAVADEPIGRCFETVLDAFVRALAGDPPARAHPTGRGLDSRMIVNRCIEHAGVIARVPTLAELCTAAHVSDRRVRSAFYEEFDLSPTRFFRSWALDLAHRRLRDSGPDECTVAIVAFDLGLHHLGRFALRYKEIYGESPSVTLRDFGG